MVGIVGRQTGHWLLSSWTSVTWTPLIGLRLGEIGFESGVPILSSWPAASGRVLQLRAVQFLTSEATKAGTTRAPRLKAQAGPTAAVGDVHVRLEAALPFVRFPLGRQREKKAWGDIGCLGLAAPARLWVKSN